MLPSNIITDVPQISAFAGTMSNIYDPMRDVVMGGIALNDPSQGRNYKEWVVSYSTGIISVGANGGAIDFTLTVANVLSVSLAFDNNMAVVLGYMLSDGAYVYYYDSIIKDFITKHIVDATSCRVCIDDLRQFNESRSDVIFGYTKAGNLYWRQQRDRYDVERLVGATTRILTRMGPNVGNRLQFELR